jgi:uncharacterized protein (TIGR00725 family)
MNSKNLQHYVAVIGGGKAEETILVLAYEVGQEIARRGAVLVCGGLGGVMQAAAQGANEAGGVTIGILPGPDRRAANPFLTYSLVTNLGHARNMVLAHSADGLIAVDGGYGTISEAAIALKLGKPVVGLAYDWHLARMQKAFSPQEAVDIILQEIWKGAED